MIDGIAQNTEFSAQSDLGWTSVLVHPRDPNKNINIYSRVGGVAYAKSSTALPIQKLPAIKSNFCSADTLGKFFSFTPSHWAAPTLLGAAALSIASGAAVKISAAPLIATYLSVKTGKTQKTNPYTHYDANRQALRRRQLPCSANQIMSELLEECGLSQQVEVLIYRSPKRSGGLQRSVVVIPRSGCASKVAAEKALREITAGLVVGPKIQLANSNQFSIWRTAEKFFNLAAPEYDNFVQHYMRKHIRPAMLRPAVHLDDALKIVERLGYSGNYRNTLQSELISMYSDGFSCHYRRAANSDRMFGVGSSIQFIPGRLRRELFPHLMELDFANMHLALANSKLNLGFDLTTSFWEQLFASQTPILDDLVAASLTASGSRNTSLVQKYPEIFSNLDCYVDVVPEHMTGEFLKEFNKTATYAVLFGKSAATQISATAESLRNVGVNKELSLILARIICRSPQLTKISEKIADYCSMYQIDAGKLSAEFQNLETQYVKYIYDVADRMGANNVRILIHSHDGVSLQFADARQGRRFFSLIASSLDRQLAADGICTKLEAKTSSGKKIDIANIADSQIVGFKKKKLKKARNKQAKITGFFSEKISVCLSKYITKIWGRNTGPPFWTT